MSKFETVPFVMFSIINMHGSSGYCRHFHLHFEISTCVVGAAVVGAAAATVASTNNSSAFFFD